MLDIRATRDPKNDRRKPQRSPAELVKVEGAPKPTKSKYRLEGWAAPGLWPAAYAQPSPARAVFEVLTNGEN